jgi:hypothetical protein
LAIEEEKNGNGGWRLVMCKKLSLSRTGKEFGNRKLE